MKVNENKKLNLENKNIMEELVRIDEVKEKLTCLFNKSIDGSLINQIEEFCSKLTKIEAKPISYAFWEHIGNSIYYGCSNCHMCFSGVSDDDNYDNYCRHCGAKMQGIKQIELYNK